MAKCDEGYLCEICGQEVEGIVDSDLYLRFVIGEMDPEQLHTSPERHINCNPILAQFIQHDDFQLVGEVPEGFAANDLDPSYVSDRQSLVTRGFKRLKELASMEELPIYEYPLKEVRTKWT